VRNFGSLVPADALVVNWALARLGADSREQLEIDGREVAIPTLASGLYQRFRRTRRPSDYLGGGLVVDVWSGEEGIRFSSADRSSMDESTGVPAAAGILLMLEGGPDDSGVFAPECLDPSEFFAALGRCSRGSGSLGAYRLWGSEQGERIRIRDLLNTRVR
jgi:saccharopine dehydrogenase-like NADP-dependent oxidoreductase